MKVTKKRLIHSAAIRTVAAIVVSAGGVLASGAPATFTGIGQFPQGTLSFANAVSADGSTVVGEADLIVNFALKRHGFRWTAATGLQDIGAIDHTSSAVDESSASAVNADGTAIAGTSTSWDPVHLVAHQRPFRWVGNASGGTIQNLGTLPGGLDTYGFGISGDGSVVVGIANFSDASVRGFRWTLSGGMASVIPQMPDYTRNFAQAVSADGLSTVGSAYDCGVGESGNSVRVRPSDGLRCLDRLPGTFRSIANAVNPDGTIIVGSSDDSDYTYAYRLIADEFGDGTAEDLGMPKGFSDVEDVEALGVSADGSVIIGHYYDELQEFDGPFVWFGAGGMFDLTEYLTDAGADLTGWTLTKVNGISADGRTVVGVGSHKGRWEGWIATFGPPCVCDLNGDGLVDDADFVNFVFAYNILDCEDPSMTLGCPADFNGDAAVDDSDFVLFLVAYNDLICP